MPIVIYEKAGQEKWSLDIKGSTASFEYVIGGTNDIIVAEALAQSTAPAFFANLTLLRIEMSEIGNGWWIASCNYGIMEGGNPNSENPTDGQGGGSNDSSDLGPEFSWETTGGSQHITQSLRTVSKTGALVGGVALAVPDNQQAIGATKDKVDGCDVVIPKLEFSYTLLMIQAGIKVNLAYVRGLQYLTGQVNLNSFLNYPAGSLLFLGATGEYRGDQQGWKITFKFASNPNQVNLIVSPSITVPAKNGWDYLWCGYKEQADAIANTTIQQPSYAYVEQVYRYTDFKTYLKWGRP